MARTPLLGRDWRPLERLRGGLLVLLAALLMYMWESRLGTVPPLLLLDEYRGLAEPPVGWDIRKCVDSNDSTSPAASVP